MLTYLDILGMCDLSICWHEVSLVTCITEFECGLMMLSRQGQTPIHVNTHQLIRQKLLKTLDKSNKLSSYLTNSGNNRTAMKVKKNSQSHTSLTITENKVFSGFWI